MNHSALKNKLIQTADQCVKCGLCIPHCPTYRLCQDEAESPRGRIALIQGLAENHLRDSERLRYHLASCLECRACEVACPSLVQYGSLMDDARALENLRSGSFRRRVRKARLDALSNAFGIHAIAALAALYRITGIASLAERVGVERRPRLHAVHRLATLLGRPPGPDSGSKHAVEPGEPIDLFLGCVARISQPGAIRAAHRVLERLGFRVRNPGHQACCGAIHRHNGFPAEADRLLERTASASAGRLMVGIASACVAELRTHPSLAGTGEICRFLADVQWPQDLGLRPLRAKVALHEPCSHRNQLRDSAPAYDLLRRLAGVELVSLEDNAFCCGAAGTYLLQQPALSRALLAPKLEALATLDADILVTTNTGCALHLAAGVREMGLAVEVLHPVELIARQLTD